MLVVAPDPKPQAELAITERRIKEYASRCNADYIAIRELPKVNHPCANKFVLSQVAKLYEQTLLVDTDVVVQDHCPNVFELVPLGKWAMVDDLRRIRERDDKWIEREWPAVCKAMGATVPLNANWNSGFCLAPQDAYREYYAPRVPVPDVWCIEQHLLCWHLLQAPERIQTLPDQWQAGYVWNSFLQDAETAYTIHINGCWHAPTRLALLEHFDRSGGPIDNSVFSKTPKQYWPVWLKLLRQEEIRKKIAARRAKFDHLVSWIKAFRSPGDAGVGDTIARLHSLLEVRRPDSPTAQQLKSLLKLYSCNSDLAVRYLNVQQPYAARTAIRT